MDTSCKKLWLVIVYFGMYENATNLIFKNKKVVLSLEIRGTTFKTQMTLFK